MLRQLLLSALLDLLYLLKSVFLAYFDLLDEEVHVLQQLEQVDSDAHLALGVCEHFSETGDHVSSLEAVEVYFVGVVVYWVHHHCLKPIDVVQRSRLPEEHVRIGVYLAPDAQPRVSLRLQEFCMRPMLLCFSASMSFYLYTRRVPKVAQSPTNGLSNR